MSERDTLVSVINSASISQRVNAELLADYLIKHGVTIKEDTEKEREDK